MTCRVNKPKGDKKENTGEEAPQIFNVSSAWPETKFSAQDQESLLAEDMTKESVMQWSIGDLSLIKGVFVNGEDDRKTGINQVRRVLKHMRYDKQSGNFVPSNQKKLNRMSVSLKVDQRNHTVLWEMLDHAAGVEASKRAKLRAKATEANSIADTGATVCCSGTDIMQDMGLTMKNLLPTNLTLFAANRKGLTVLGAVPVLITAKTVDGGQPVTTRDLLYIVEELTFMFLSRDALVNLGSISMSFPSIPNPRSYGWVAGVQQGSNADTVIEQPCLKPDKFEGELADCGCPMRAAHQSHQPCLSQPMRRTRGS